MDIYIIQSCII